MHALLVYNPVAGNGHTLSLLPAIQKEMGRRGYEVCSLETSLDGHFGKNLSKTLQSLNQPKILVIGGDGTLCDFLNSFQDYHLPVGIIQSGTGNDFSAAIHYPKKWQKQLDLALEGTAKPVDIWTCNERKFLNGIGIGFDGYVAHKTNELRKKGNFKKWSYWKSILATIFTYGSHKMEIEIEDEILNLDAFLVTAANGKAFGGGFKLTPKADVGDGLLDLCVVKKVSMLQRLLRLPFIPFGKHTNMSVVVYKQAKSLTIKSPNSIWAHIDGEPFKSDKFEFKLLDQQLLLRY